MQIGTKMMQGMNHKQTKLTKHTTTWTCKGTTISFPIIYFMIGSGVASK